LSFSQYWSLSQRLSRLQEEYQFLELGVESYRDVLHQISTLVHPFAVDGSGFQTGVDVANSLRALLPMNKVEVEQWRDWATSMVAKFQRTTSAIEGRNGYLSRLHHNGRGLSEKDLQVLTIIHNFDLKRADGSTAASRFFGRNFPELFPWLMSRIGDLPEPRKPRKLRNFTISIA
jgi:hypothetical protein